MIDRARIRQYVEANGRRFVDTLKASCVWPSISTEARGLEQMADWLDATLQGLGARVSRLRWRGRRLHCWARSTGPAGRAGAR